MQIKSFLIYKLYEKHLYSKYGYCYVVFDCYGNGPSSKDMQHANKYGTGLPDITFISDEKCVKSQDDFLVNQNNKAHFIVGLSNLLFQNGFQRVADADAPLREKGPSTEFFLVRIFLYSDIIHENTDQKNSVFGHFSRSEKLSKSL